MKRIGNVIVTLIFFIVLAYNAYYAPLPDIKVSNTCLLYTSPSPRDS